MIVEVPESVYAYFTDTKVRSAVALLLSKAKPKIPEDLDWSEFPAFYRAIAASRQTQSEFAGFLHEMWSATWRNFPDAWEADAPSVGGQCIDVLDIWSNGYLSRTSRLGGVTCDLSVYLDDALEGIQVGFELVRGNRSLIKKSDLQLRWEADDDCFWSASEALPLSRSIDLSELDAFCKEARTVIAEKMNLRK